MLLIPTWHALWHGGLLYVCCECIAKVLFIIVHVFAVLNGPISPNSGKGNEPNLMKWFGTDVLKTSLPHMPPIPTQGQRVMTVDEIERHTQAVSN